VPGDGKWTSAVSGLITADDDVLVLHEGGAPEILLDALDASGVTFMQLEVPPPEVELTPLPSEQRVVIVHSAAAGEAFVELTRGLPVADASALHCCGPGAHAHEVKSPLQPLEGVRLVATSPAAAEALQSLGVEVYATASATAADAVVDAALRALSE